MRPVIRGSLLASSCALALLGGVLAGCGSSSPTGTSADPAGVVPASAPAYLGAVVRPEGNLKSAAAAAGEKLTNQKDPYQRLLGILRTPGSPMLDYSSEVSPWLGPNAGLFVTSLGSSNTITSLLTEGLTGGGAGAVPWPFGAGGTASAGGTSGAGGAGGTGGTGGAAQGALVLDTSDLAAAEKFVENAASRAHAHGAAFKGVSYRATSSGEAFAIVDKFVVLGTESGVHAVIETARGAPDLAHQETYAHLQSLAPSGVLAHAYENPAQLTAARPSHAAQLPALLQAFGGAHPVNVSLVPSANSLAIDADVGPVATGTHAQGGGGLVEAAATGGKALGELPGESWLAAGLGNVGGTAGGSLSSLRSLLGLASTLGASSAGAGVAAPQTALSVKGLLEGLLTPLSALSANTAQARRDYLSWMGDAGVFASGTSVLELRGGVVIDSTDPAASRAAVATLADALRKGGAEVSSAKLAGTEAAIEARVTGLPLALVIAAGHSASGQAKFVLGLGAASVQAALDPPNTMLTSAAYSSAASALGEGIQPSIAVDFSTLLSLLESVGLSEDPTIGPFTPYLRAAGTLAGGGKSLGGGVQRLRLVLGLQSSSSDGGSSSG